MFIRNDYATFSNFLNACFTKLDFNLTLHYFNIPKDTIPFAIKGSPMFIVSGRVEAQGGSLA